MWFGAGVVSLCILSALSSWVDITVLSPLSMMSRCFLAMLCMCELATCQQLSVSGAQCSLHTDGAAFVSLGSDVKRALCFFRAKRFRSRCSILCR